ncbi:hypothetical protein [Mesonia sp.]|nr:hypothetical protein [Mesonia sp.]|tara:strand:+ start:8021 stop:8626 length:606 start_codon:yes stop_codon:yes gene_type:complete
MMINLKHYITTFSLLSIFLSGFAQEENTSKKDNSINTQFEEVIEESNNYQDYKVVKKYKLTQLQKNTVNRINGLNKEIEDSNKTIKEQEAKIENLKSQLNSTKNDLNQVTQEKDEISFFGIPTQKGTYQTIMWIIVFVLVMVLVFFIYKYKKSKVLTKEAKKNLADNEAEFDEYRKKAIEKQQKLGRQLQDEINKHNKNKH